MRGAAQELSVESAAEMVHRLERQIPAPWAAGIHNHWVLFIPQLVTGRRLTDAVFAPLY